MSSPSALNPDTLAAIAIAEGQREMLQHLAEWGMALSKDICQRSMDSPYHPELKHDPGRAFAAASRAVRLTLAMQARVQKEIIALRNGVAPATAPSVAEPTARGGEHPDGSRDELREVNRASVERKVGEVDEARVCRDREHLTEGEDFEAAVAGDVHACVAGIQGELSSLSSRYGEGEPEPSVLGEVGSYAASPSPGTSPITPPRASLTLRLGHPHQGKRGRETEPIFEEAG